jgi:two-component system sensor histidine kinase ChiS
MDLMIVQATLGLAGASIQNALLYNHILEANRQLRTSNERLGELDRLKSEFLSNLNHELRTPLATVLGALQCLEGAVPGPEQLRSLVRMALQKAEHLRDLVENLLMFSDVSTNRMPFHLETLDVRETLVPWYEARVPGITSELREFTYTHARDLPRATFDPQRLAQILDELVENALKFTPKGCCLRLDVSARQEAGRRWVALSLSDNGPGIPAERMESLFNSFEQVDGSLTRTVGGLGVGLAFCKRLAERMDCVLQASSTLGEGTTFTLLLPAA